MSNKEGIPQQPLTLTVLKDLQKLGHAFFYQKIDARKYLLPQRRNRVFGCSVKTGDKSAQEIQDQGNCWKEVFCRMGAGPTAVVYFERFDAEGARTATPPFSPRCPQLENGSGKGQAEWSEARRTMYAHGVLK